MFCNQCGHSVNPNSKYCGNCGNLLSSTNQNSNSKMALFGAFIGLGCFLLVFFASTLMKNASKKYYFNSEKKTTNQEIIKTTHSNSIKKGKYSTVIIYDNTYSGVNIKSNKDAYSLIEQDSVEQKDHCPSAILEVENQIINRYGITAVNLCEMNVDFAKELGNVFQKIYEEFPTIKGYITNLTLVNTSMETNYIAAFMPVFSFATSNTSSTYPWIIKTQVLLNTSYFLNEQRLEESVKAGSVSGHFPDNATIYSPVAHELGHYLSFLAMMKHYQLKSILLINQKNISTFYDVFDDFEKGEFSYSLIKEAYDSYKKDTKSSLSLDEWRGTISHYALAKNNSGDYIYDETIAEAFHDFYLNGDSASTASKYIVRVLKNKLEGDLK